MQVPETALFFMAETVVERFIDCHENIITNKMKILLQMSVILTHAVRKPVIRIGRIAGQFSKPRSI